MSAPDLFLRLLSTRRSFLKTAGATALGAALPSAALAHEPAGNAPEAPADAEDLLRFVNILQGTDSTIEFSRGNTLPIAALPFGMTHWTLQTNADTEWMFNPHTRRLQGFRCTHQLSPWLGDYGQATFLPFRGDTRPEPGSRSSSCTFDEFTLAPHSLKLFLLRPRAHTELIPTERGALLAADFEADDLPGDHGLLIDAVGSAGEFRVDAAQRKVFFESRVNTGGVPQNFSTYYVVQFTEPWDTFELKPIDIAANAQSTNKDTSTSRVGLFHFGKRPRVEARIATSFIGFAQAERNLALELGNHSADDLRTAAARTWNTHLSRITPEGATDTQLRTFYSCLYRVLLFPRTFHELDTNKQPHHFSCFSGKVEPGVMYADHGYWDVYRAWYPLMTLVWPERLAEILQAWVNAYKEGGWMPQFPSPGYRSAMTGSLIDSVFGDAAAKKLPGFDLPTAYEGLHKHATSPGDPSKGYGRVGFELYDRLGYVPADKIQQAAAETVDSAYGDFCIAQFAQTLGKSSDHDLFLKRSANWHNLYDSATHFFRGKNADGSWITPFLPIRWGAPYVEGSAWQHRWDAPQDIPGMIAAAGGPAAAVTMLEAMLSTPPEFEVGIYGYELHEMAEMAAVKFGQYDHGNQPSHHMLYLFAHAGRPDLTRHWVRRVLNELYSPDTFAGDEDTGSMAAWYVISALGFYPHCPGKPEYTLGAPLFPAITVQLPGNKTLRITTANAQADPTAVRQVTLAGHALTGITVQHASLLEGGELRFS